MVALAQVLFKYFFLPAFKVPTVLNMADFVILCLAVICATASGNIINDIHDIKTDIINRKSRPLAQQRLSTASAYVMYIILNILALLSAFYISNRVNDYTLLFAVISVIILLFFYAKILKAIPILGNLLVSVLVSLSFMLVVYIELVNSQMQNFSSQFKYWLIGYTVFAFWANLNREWIKDVQDIKGDHAQNISTLPILIGKSRMNMLIFASTLFLVLAMIAGVKVYFQLDLVFILYLTFGICVPLCFVLIHIHKKQLNTNYKLLSKIYKLVMLLGVLSLILFEL